MTSLRRPWLLAALILFGTTTAVAQTPSDPPPPPQPQGDTATEPEPTTAQGWFRRGENVYRVGRYQEAVDAWRRAFELDPRPRIQYNLAQAYERLGRLEDAVAAYQFYLSNGDQYDEVYADANARVAALRTRIESTGVMLRGGPAGGEIRIDGQVWGYTPRPDRISLSPGSHLIEIAYTDGRTYRTTVSTPAGQEVSVIIADSDLTAPPQVIRVEAELSHAMLFTGIGMAGAGVGFLIYGIERQSKVSTCSDPDNFCRNLSAGEVQRSVGLATGATLTAAGAALIVVDLIRHRGRGDDEEPSALTCAPLMAGATCRLRF